MQAKLKITDGVSNIIRYLLTYQIWAEFQSNRDPQFQFEIDWRYELDDGIPIYDWKDPDKWRDDPSPLIAVDGSIEGLHIFDPKLVEKYNTDKVYLIFTGSTWDPKDFPMPFKYYPYFCDIPIIETRQFFSHPGSFNAIWNLAPYDYNQVHRKHFCAMVGRKTTHRSLFVEGLQSRFDPAEYILKYDYQLLAGEDFKQHDWVLQDIRSTEYFTCSLENSILHRRDTALPITAYNNSNFVITVETNIDFDGRPEAFVTNKTYYPMFLGIPFIVVATPGLLKGLRDRGFKTYNTLWDESYDDEPDMMRRFEKIYSLIEELKYFDWLGFKDELRHIAEFNFRHAFANYEHMQKNYQGFTDFVKTHYATITNTTPS